MVKFTKTLKVNASADKVWKTFAHEFNDAAKATASTVVSVLFLLAISYFSIRTMERGIHYES